MTQTLQERLRDTDAKCLGKLQAIDQHYFEKLKLPFHFTTRHAPQSQIDALLKHGLAVETGLVGIFKMRRCYRLTQKGVTYGK